MDLGRSSFCEESALSQYFASHEQCGVSYGSVLCVLARETRDLTRAKSRAKSESPTDRACRSAGQDYIVVKVGHTAFWERRELEII